MRFNLNLWAAALSSIVASASINTEGNSTGCSVIFQTVTTTVTATAGDPDTFDPASDSSLAAAASGSDAVDPGPVPGISATATSFDPGNSGIAPSASPFSTISSLSTLTTVLTTTNFITVYQDSTSVALDPADLTSSSATAYYYADVSGSTSWIDSVAPPSSVSDFITKTISLTVYPTAAAPTATTTVIQTQIPPMSTVTVNVPAEEAAVGPSTSTVTSDVTQSVTMTSFLTVAPSSSGTSLTRGPGSYGWNATTGTNGAYGGGFISGGTSASGGIYLTGGAYASGGTYPSGGRYASTAYPSAGAGSSNGLQGTGILSVASALSIAGVTITGPPSTLTLSVAYASSLNISPTGTAQTDTIITPPSNTTAYTTAGSASAALSSLPGTAYPYNTLIPAGSGNSARYTNTTTSLVLNRTPSVSGPSVDSRNVSNETTTTPVTVSSTGSYPGTDSTIGSVISAASDATRDPSIQSSGMSGTIFSRYSILSPSPNATSGGRYANSTSLAASSVSTLSVAGNPGLSSYNASTSGVAGTDSNSTSAGNATTVSTLTSTASSKDVPTTSVAASTSLATRMPIPTSSTLSTIFTGNASSTGSPTSTINATGTGNATSTGGASSASPSVCGEHGDFLLTWDDLPTFSPTQPITDPSEAPPVFNPYHHLYFSSGFVYIPPPSDPFPPISSPRLVMFLTSETGPTSSVNAGLELSGEIGAGDRASESAFWFNAYSAYVGCDNEGPEVCTFEVSGYKYNGGQNETLAYQQNYTIEGCPGYKNCHLEQITFPKSMVGLSGVRFQAFVENQKKVWFMDNLALGWYNNTCSAGLLRSESQ